jgi:hypothetical protein
METNLDQIGPEFWESLWPIVNEMMGPFKLSEVSILCHDAVAAWTEDRCSPREWIRRIGGAKNLRSYLDCLMVHA